jgi:DNA polymerase-4
LLLARIATEHAKPNGQRLVTQQEAAAFLRGLPVDRLPGVGWSTGRRLAELGIQTVADVQVGG